MEGHNGLYQFSVLENNIKCHKIYVFTKTALLDTMEQMAFKFEMLIYSLQGNSISIGM